MSYEPEGSEGAPECRMKDSTRQVPNPKRQVSSVKRPASFRNPKSEILLAHCSSLIARSNRTDVNFTLENDEMTEKNGGHTRRESSSEGRKREFDVS